MIEQTIEQAAERFGVTVEAIRNVARRKDRLITEAREWVIRQHPELGSTELSRAMGYSHHSAIINIRKKLQTNDRLNGVDNAAKG